MENLLKNEEEIYEKIPNLEIVENFSFEVAKNHIECKFIKNIFLILLLVSQKQLLKLEKLETILGLKFKNKFLLLEALTSVSCQTKFGNLNFNYERLEFFGDAILKFVTTNHLYLNYPEADESQMSLKKSQTVDNIASLPMAAKHLNLFQFIEHKIVFQEGTSTKNDVMSDVIEALIGAIYLEKGGLYKYGNSKREYDIYGNFIHKNILYLRRDITPKNAKQHIKGIIGNKVATLHPKAKITYKVIITQFWN